MTKQEKAKDLYLKRTYNITLKERQAVLEFQDYKCYICQKPESDFKNALAVDHNHREPGQCRGLLCWKCNKALQKFDDCPDKLSRAANYINFNPFFVVFGKHILVPPDKRKSRRRRRKAKPRTKAKRR